MKIPKIQPLAFYFLLLMLAISASNNKAVAQNYGDVVKIQHILTNTHLHSHAIAYSHPQTSGQQQVTAFGGTDDNDYWVIRPEHGNQNRSGSIRQGDIIRLQHWLTGANLHSHAGIPSPITQQQEVTCFGANGEGDSNDNWRIEIEGGGTWAIGQRIRLIHVNTNQTLHSHAGFSHPEWTVGQQEVTAFGGRDDNDLWQLSEVRAIIFHPVDGTIIARANWFNPLSSGLSTASIRVNNYTSIQNQFNSTGERAFLRPNDCFFNLDMAGSPFRLGFNVDMVEGGPDNRCKAYINDWNSRSVNVSTSAGAVQIRLDFENNGTELVTNCYNNACCEGNIFCPGAGCPDYELNNAWIDMSLTPTLSRGRLSYSSAVNFNVDVRELGNDPCTNNFWAFLCDWGVIPRVGDRQNRIRRAIEDNLLSQLENPLLRVGIENVLNDAVSRNGIDLTRYTSVSIDNSGNLVFR